MSFMDKDQVIEDFFRGFRVTLTNSFSYPKDHPYFIKSVESFKSILEETLLNLNPLKIGITDSGLVVDEKNLTKVGFYDELASLLHQRKIKSIQIKNGSSIEELIKFFSVITLPQKEIFKAGGINAILGKEKLPHFIIDELDYSVFLTGRGKECTDIWGYMLKEAACSNNAVELDKMADDFGNFIRNSDEKDIIESENIPSGINEFLTCLKDKNKGKFYKCAKEVFLWLLRNQRSLNEEKLAKLKPVFNSLTQEDFSALLWEGLTREDDFDALSLQFFSKITEQKNPDKIAEGFLNKANQSQHLKDDHNLVEKFRNLLSKTQGDQLSLVYHNTLEFLIKGVSPTGGLSFDQKQLRENYRYLVLSMLATGKDENTLKQAAEILEGELPVVFVDNDFAFLKDLHRLLITKKKEDSGACAGPEKKLSALIEEIILNQSLLPEQEFLTGMVSVPAFELNFYLDKIFNSGKNNKQVLTLFFRLFPGNQRSFYKRLKQKLPDMEFISDLVKTLGSLDLPVSSEILEYIYSVSNELIKFNVLKAIRKLKKTDITFFTRQLNTNSFPLRKNLCSILMLDAQAKEAVLNLLFKIPGFWGNNKLLMENMQIVFDLRFIEGIKNVKDLSRRRFFWNRQLRDKAKQILKEWNVS